MGWAVCFRTPSWLSRPATGTGDVISVVTFDVVVTVTDETGAGGKLSVLGLGMQGGVKAETVAQNRIQFAVPVQLPKPAPNVSERVS
jgi:hypothetical protein